MPASLMMSSRMESLGDGIEQDAFCVLLVKESREQHLGERLDVIRHGVEPLAVGGDELDVEPQAGGFNGGADLHVSVADSEVG